MTEESKRIFLSSWGVYSVNIFLLCLCQHFTGNETGTRLRYSDGEGEALVSGVHQDRMLPHLKEAQKLEGRMLAYKKYV